MDSTIAIHVINIVRLHAVYYFDAVFLSRFPHIRKSLSNSVVCNCYCGHVPVCSSLNCLGRICKRVQSRESRMEVQLHAFFRSIVRAHIFFALGYAPGLYCYVFSIFIERDLSADCKMITLGYLVED